MSIEALKSLRNWEAGFLVTKKPRPGTKKPRPGTKTIPHFLRSCDTADGDKAANSLQQKPFTRRNLHLALNMNMFSQ